MIWPFRRRSKLDGGFLPLDAEELERLFEDEMAAEGLQPATVVLLKLYLQQFIDGVTDPSADPRALANVQIWAMSVAKDHGAASPREALSMLRGHLLDDDEWAKEEAYWSFAWPNIISSR